MQTRVAAATGTKMNDQAIHLTRSEAMRVAGIQIEKSHLVLRERSVQIKTEREIYQAPLIGIGKNSTSDVKTGSRFKRDEIHW